MLIWKPRKNLIISGWYALSISRRAGGWGMEQVSPSKGLPCCWLIAVIIWSLLSSAPHTETRNSMSHTVTIPAANQPMRHGRKGLWPLVSSVQLSSFAQLVWESLSLWKPKAPWFSALHLDVKVITLGWGISLLGLLSQNTTDGVA